VTETIRLGEVIGKYARGGEVIGLVGELGTGKTHLIKGIGRGLKVLETDAVTSPTFVLINEYQGRLRLYHVDAYRLENAGQLEALGFDEICQSEALVVVEWADRVRQLIEEYEPIWVYMEHVGMTERLIRLENLPAGMTEEISKLPGAH
jgi:tRNA threonylcarbamoyladenosine biosynthesis protein TsaE